MHSGTSEFVNNKASTILKLLCGRYCLNSLRHKFNNNYSPKCQMCSMNATEDIDHFLTICPYLDGARHYTLLLWKHHLSNIVYNLFHSAILKWPSNKLTTFLLDPMSQLSVSDITHHQNLKLYIYQFAQDFVFSIHCQRQLYYGDWSKSWSTQNYQLKIFIHVSGRLQHLVLLFVCFIRLVTGSWPEMYVYVSKQNIR